MPKRKRRIYSERRELVEKSREAALSAVQIYNNPNTTFKTESFIVLFIIAWVYLLHAHCRGEKIEYRHFRMVNGRRRFDRLDGAYKYCLKGLPLFYNKWIVYGKSCFISNCSGENFSDYIF